MRVIDMSKLPKYQVYLPAVPGENSTEKQAAHLRKLITEHPEDEEYLLNQLMLYVSLIDDNETLLLGERMLQIGKLPENIYDAHLVMARSYANKKDNKKAVLHYNKCITPDSKVEDESVAEDNDCEDAIMELAQLYADAFDYENAIKTYKLLDNDHIEYGKENMHRCTGDAYYNLRQFDKALHHYQQALALNPEDADNSMTQAIGEAYWHLKEYDKAMAQFKQVLDRNPLDARAYYSLGLCYQDTDDYYMAMHNYMEALKIKPDYAEAINNIGALSFIHEGDIKFVSYIKFFGKRA